MAKEKTVFVCSACGYETPRWMGKCPGCNAWNTLEEQAPQAAQQAAPVKANKQRPGTGASAMRLSEIPEETSAARRQASENLTACSAGAWWKVR